jgi:hypothetical protein
MILQEGSLLVIWAQVKVVMKEVTNTQYVACMNPTAGSFQVTPRMQRHFATFAVQMPSVEIIRRAQSQEVLKKGCSSRFL